MNALHAPAALYELRGQPIQQFRMCRPLAHDSEVTRSRDDPASEMVLPNPVRHHAGRQRIGGIRQPAAQGGPPAGCCQRRDRLDSGWLRIEYRREAGLDLFQWIRVEATTENVGWRGFGANVDDPDAPGNLGRLEVLQLREGRVELVEARSVFDAQFPHDAPEGGIEIGFGA